MPIGHWLEQDVVAAALAGLARLRRRRPVASPHLRLHFAMLDSSRRRREAAAPSVAERLTE